MGKNEKTMLGRSLVKHMNQVAQQNKEKGRIYNKQNKKVLESVTEVTDIEAVLEQAEESERLFSSENPIANVFNMDKGSNSKLTAEDRKREEALHASSLRVPRTHVPRVYTITALAAPHLLRPQTRPRPPPDLQGLGARERRLVQLRPDVQHPYKLQLHTYAQRNNLSLPSYSTTSIGPPHASHFVACVTVVEQEFRSPAPSRTVKEAENAAAKAALGSLSPDGFEQISSGYVKNLLQELAQKEELSAPKYKTSTSGPVHMRMFCSTVEVGGEVFEGKAARSKKVSLINAAEVAYRALEERRLNQKNSTIRRASPEIKDLEPKNHSEFTNSHRDREDSTPFLQVSYSAKTRERMAEAKPLMTDLAMTSKSLEGEFGALSMAEPGPAHSAARQSYLLCNRVRVYTSVPQIKFPEGVCLLQVADYKWVPVSLEFPLQKDV